MLQYGREVNVLIVRLKEKGISDADVPSLVLALESYVHRMVDPSLPITMDVDVSMNSLSDVGIALLMGWMRHLIASHQPGAQVRILKLYKNKASNEACKAIALLLQAQQAPIQEIHLSHNEIGRRGFVMLLAALAAHPGSVYPRHTSTGPCPCWVRMEHNQVSGVDALLAALAKPPLQLRVCFAPRNQRGASCTSHACNQSRDWDTVAHVHLFCIQEQRAPSECTKEKVTHLVQSVLSEGASALKSVSNIDLGGLESELCHQAACCPETSSAEMRIVSLKVDPAKGAGLELEESPY
eukprot:3412396-Amphidinium_carterae.1